MATQATIRPGRRFSGSGSGGTVPLNVEQTKGSQITITAAVAKPATVVSVTITTQGNPVQIIVSGDANPSSAGWGRLNIYRDTTAVGQQVQFESNGANENVPYSLQVVDQPAAGTWTYSLKVDSITTDTQFGEAAGPIITAAELGGVGSATPSGAASGDLGGSYPSPDVVAIQGYSISTTAPGSGEALVWDGSNWSPTAISAGAGGNDTNIQYNSSGSLTGTNNFIFDAGSNRVSLTDGSQALDIYSNLIEYVGPGSLLIESNTTVDIGTLSATGINLGGTGVASTFAGAFTLPTADGAAGEVLTTDGAGSVSWQSAQVNQQVYVSEGADPTVANGSPLYPYATIATALSSIIDASPTKRYTISVAGGAYNEGATLNIKPNVFIAGAASGAVRITATSFGMDSSFSAGSGVDNRSGFQNVILIGGCNFDWSTVTSSAGKLYFVNTIFNNSITLNGYNNTIAQAQFTSCQFFGNFTNSGINVGVFANNSVFANIVLNQHSTLATVLQTSGGYCSGSLTATTTVNTFARRISIFARSFWMDSVTVDGPQTYLDYTVDSIPASGATVLNGATLVSIDAGTGANKDLSNLNYPTAVNNPIIPAATSATNFGDWGFQWFWSFAYLHASTGTDCYLISYPSAFGAETGPGKNVYVYADGAGLATDVSGGNVGLYTSNATGTGASGYIEAETGASVNGDTGFIKFTTGTPSGSGRRGTVIINSPLTHSYGTLGATPAASDMRKNATYLTTQATIALPSMTSDDDGLRIEIVSTASCVVTPPSGAANQRSMTARGGSTWIWIDSQSDWFCISTI